MFTEKHFACSFTLTPLSYASKINFRASLCSIVLTFSASVMPLFLKSESFCCIIENCYKYTIGLSCLHGKKTDFLLQEVFARLILYNYASLIARKIPVPQEKQINFSVAILVCKQFLKGKIRSAQIFEILSKHLSPIRPGRQYKRYQNPVSAIAFQYRFS